MNSTSSMPIACLVEGDVDAAVVRRMAKELEVELGTVLVRHGKAGVLKSLPEIARTSDVLPWFVLVDLDREAECAGAYVSRILPPSAGRRLRVRIAVRAVESWFLADRSALAKFLSVPVERSAREPEDPKRDLVGLAVGSKSREVRDGVPPRPGSGRSVGPLFMTRMIEFVERAWSPQRARSRSPSLDRAMTRMDELARSDRRH